MPRSSREKIYARANVASYLDVSAASISVADPKRTKFYLARILMPTRAHASASKLEGFNQREANHRKKDGWMSWKTICSAVVGVTELPVVVVVEKQCDTVTGHSIAFSD